MAPLKLAGGNLFLLLVDVQRPNFGGQWLGPLGLGNNGALFRVARKTLNWWNGKPNEQGCGTSSLCWGPPGEKLAQNGAGPWGPRCVWKKWTCGCGPGLANVACQPLCGSTHGSKDTCQSVNAKCHVVPTGRNTPESWELGKPTACETGLPENESGQWGRCGGKKTGTQVAQRHPVPGWL